MATNILDAAKADNIDVKPLKVQASVKKLWALARKSMIAASLPSSHTGSTDGPIPDATMKDIQRVWGASHDFVLPDGFLLIDTLQGKLSRE